MQRGMAREGIYRIIKGMVKKLLIADVMSVAIVDPVFMEPGDFTGLEVLVALYAYTLQIYYDFSAYTDIAIGSALFFGIWLPENFNRPYKATSVAEFWRRWHITLSNWARDYIYYPLGGSPNLNQLEDLSKHHRHNARHWDMAWGIVELCDLWDPSRYCRVNQPSPAKAHRPASRNAF